MSASSESQVSEPVGMVLGTEDATPLQFWVAVDIKQRVRLAGLGTHGSHVTNRNVTQMAALPG